MLDALLLKEAGKNQSQGAKQMGFFLITFLQNLTINGVMETLLKTYSPETSLV